MCCKAGDVIVVQHVGSMLVSEPDVFDLPLGVGGHGAALMVQEGVVHFDRDELIRYGGSTILIKNAKKGGDKPYDNQVNRSGKVSKPFKKGYYKCGQPHILARCSLPYTTLAK